MEALQGDIARRINGRDHPDSDYNSGDDAETTIQDLLRPTKRARHHSVQFAGQSEGTRTLIPENQIAASSLATSRLMIDIDDLANRTHPSETLREAKTLDDEFCKSVDDFVVRTHPSVTHSKDTPEGTSEPFDDKFYASLDDLIRRSDPLGDLREDITPDEKAPTSIDDFANRIDPSLTSQDNPVHLGTSTDSSSSDENLEETGDSSMRDAPKHPDTTKNAPSTTLGPQRSTASSDHHPKPSQDSLESRPSPLPSILNAKPSLHHRPRTSNPTGPRRKPTSSLLKLHLTNKHNNNLPNLRSRLDSLLPKMRAANAELEVERREGRLAERNIEALGEDGEESGYVEMNLGLGVLEEKNDSNNERRNEKKRKRRETVKVGKVGIEVID